MKSFVSLFFALFFPRRFMLQLAQKTDGVIVTNDNLRDLSDESPVWRDIIKKRYEKTAHHSNVTASVVFL